MKIAQVTSFDSAPVYASAPDPQHPTPDQLQLKVIAVGVHRLVRARASGSHYSIKGEPLPLDPSVDGVGLEQSTDTLYYINTFAAPLFAERANVDRKQLVKLGNKADVDAVAVAALVNPVASSWMALRHRAVGLSPGCGFTVLVLGATSASGRVAVDLARSLGAAQVVGVGRNLSTLETVEGLDFRVVLSNGSNGPSFDIPKDLGPVHIVLDYVGGSAAVELLKTVEMESGKGLQYIQIGMLGGEDLLSIPGQLLRSKPIRIMGSGMGSWNKQELVSEMNDLVGAVARMKRPENILTSPLKEVHDVWDKEVAEKRLVLLP